MVLPKMASYTAKWAKPSAYIYHHQLSSFNPIFYFIFLPSNPPSPGELYINMGKSKEEDKIEKIIRGLLKLPENRRCINCNSLGPQYVCMTFLTYVCTNCSGVHREFTHRVKSVSMAKFSMEEVTALQAGGNERARQSYFKTWDPQRNSLPENSNIHRIRDFIKHVYVDKQYTGETHPASAQRSRNSGMYEPYEHKRVVKGESSTFHAKTIDKYSRYACDESRSPPYSGEFSRYGDSRAGSSRFEGTEGRYQVDDTRISGRAATQMFTTEDIKPRRRSPDRRRSIDAKSPTLHHVKEILGENSVALRVANHPKFADRRYDKVATANAQERDHHKESHRSVDHNETILQRAISADVQNTAESGSQPPSSHVEPKRKSESSGSLDVFTDFSSRSDISVQSLGPQMNIAMKPPAKNTPGYAHPNTLEFLLFELFSRAEMTHSNQSGIPCEENDVSSPSSNRSTWNHVLAPSTSVSQALTDECTSYSAAATTTSNTLSISMPARSTDADTPKGATSQMVPDLLGDDGEYATEDIGIKQSSSTQHLGPTLVSDTFSAPIQISHLNEGANNQPTMLPPASFAPVIFGDPTAQSPQPALGPTGEAESLIEMKPYLADTKTGGRKELPADLFASPNLLSPISASGWPAGSNNGMGFNMHYYPPQMSSAMGYLQGGSSHSFIPAGLSHATRFGSHLPGSALTGSTAYFSSAHHQSPCAPGAYMGQHFLHNKPTTSAAYKERMALVAT
ncbi:arf-GAP domain and FG repeat-containing protein 1-like isoform X2 [Chenopodium quinoa]|uniref:arf-GAP domain and FG repeat-containing protein 1-like isoform X2 n=1 Tax=Chenopodium quinoa TaxID=63459 RepID=UPI000B7835EA|nr:arf-GAP domain and FG repeat-containing protein 1-like isoform X2 [Chenopodium quinoa]